MASEERSAEQAKELAVIIMGSSGDKPQVDEITKVLTLFGIEHHELVGSAHKTPEFVLAQVRQYNDSPRPIVYITVAGRSDALSAFVDAATTHPVIAAPPYSEKFGFMSILSSLNVPSGIGNTVALYPEQAALAVAKIFALTNPELQTKIAQYQKEGREVVIRANYLYVSDGSVIKGIPTID